MAKGFFLVFMLLLNVSSLQAGDSFMISGGCEQPDHNVGSIKVFDPHSNELYYSATLPATNLPPLAASTACFKEGDTTKILYTGSDSFYILTLTKDFSEPALRSIKNQTPATTSWIYNTISSIASSLNPWSSAQTEVPSFIISTAALIEKKDKTFSILIGDREGYTTEYDSSGNKIRVLGGQQKADRGGVSSFMMYENQGEIYLASGSNSGLILIRDFKTGNVVQQFQAPQNITSIVVYKNGQDLYLIAGMNGYTMPDNPIGGIICFNITTAELVYQVSYDSAGDKGPQMGQWGFVNGLVLSSFGLFTIASDAHVKIWNPKTGAFITELNNGLKPWDAWVTNVLSYTKEDGKNYVVVGNTKGQVDFWNLENNTLEASRQMPAQGPRGASVFCRDIALMKGGVCTVTGDSGDIVSYSLDTYDEIGQINFSGDNDLMFRSLATLPENNLQSGIIVNSDSDAAGYDIQFFSFNKLLSL